MTMASFARACAEFSNRRPTSKFAAKQRAGGLSAKEVATELSISTKTVEAHRTSLMRKLGVRKATELVRYARRDGLIEP